MIKPNRLFVILATFALSLSRVGSGGLSAQTWDVLNETYGSGPGEVSFNASYSYVFGSVAPLETLSAGKATLSVPQGAGVLYPYKPPTVPVWPGGNADVTLEWKLAFRQGGSAAVFFSETQSASSTWGGIATFDLTYCSGSACYTTNAIADYMRRMNGQNLAPAGFNSSTAHIYRFVRQGGTNSLYLDNDPVPLISPLVNHPGGAAGDGYRWGWGFYQNTASTSEVDLYYLKGGQGAFPPGATPPIPARRLCPGG